MNAVWEGRDESDRFNALVLAAGLTWRQVVVLRAYAKYMRQGRTPFGQDSIEDALRGNVDITRLLVRLFEARFDPGRNGDLGADNESRSATTADLEDRITAALEDVASLDHDRILRSYLSIIKATLRTNFYQHDDQEGRRATSPSSSTRARSRTCPSRGRSSRSSCTPRGSRASTCASAPSPAADCAGRTGVTTSAPRCSGWSRHRW